MEDNILIDAIRNEYTKARLSLFPSPNIKRGTGRTISSFAEDAFAMYVSDMLGDEYEIWVDPQIIVDKLRNKSGKRKLMFRPDVCAVNKQNMTIEMIFDLKMNLGYKRTEFTNQVNNRIVELTKIKKHTAKCSTIKDQSLTFNNSLVWNYIIFSMGNISEKDFLKVKNYFNGNNDAQLFTLSEGDHLIKIKKDEFERLKQEIMKIKGSIQQHV